MILIFKTKIFFSCSMSLLKFYSNEQSKILACNHIYKWKNGADGKNINWKPNLIFKYIDNVKFVKKVKNL